MSRLINPETPAVRRRNIIKLLAAMPICKDPDSFKPQMRNDLLAFIILSLEEIEKTIQESTIPWEKRGFWNKADQLQKEWSWVGNVKYLLIHLEGHSGWEKWPEDLADFYKNIKFDQNSLIKLKEFWEGSYQKYLKQKNRLHNN